MIAISHPQTDFPARCTTGYPILTTMENCNGGYGSDAVASKLRELVTRTTVDVDKTIHISDAESLDMRLRIYLPLRTETIRC
ncbi:unnamed protein product [Aspergillus oryzae var. brunneus]|uniref:Unnamed protein product n=1 Tax=Aspergillus oryzae var. brunneus TaxID=332754 RepID=A0ABQ6KU76_ASPOZ|nr:unnamed protein product [Aspergillus oryzae]GMG46998.1 unnamed protein product [Aspergillus oryzae var. brunneus]